MSGKEQIMRTAANGRPVEVRQPGLDEIAERMALPVERVSTIIEIAARRHAIALDTPVGDGTARLMDFIPDRRTITSEEAVIQKNLADALQTALARLTSRETELLRRRFGIGRHPASTLQEIANDFRLSRERIRQIQNEGIAKMKRFTSNRRSDFTDE